MGKGSRNRQVRTDDKAVNPQKYVLKKKKSSAPKHLTSILTIVVIVVVAVSLLVGGIANSGMILRMQDAMETQNFEVSGTMMSYFAHTAYQNYISQYEQYISSSANYSVYSLLGIDPNEDLDKQVKNKETGETWFDYFMSLAKEQVEELLLYCEGAHAAGIELDDEDLEQIDYSIMMYEVYASYYGYSTSSYIASNFGKGVREKDLRAALKLEALASKFVEKLSEDYREAATAESVEKFFDENTNDYLSADYLSYTIESKLGTISATTSAEDAEKIKKEYEDAKAAADELAEKLKAATTADEFKAVVETYLNETLAEDYHEKYYDDYLKKAEGETDEEKAANAEKKVAEKLKEDIDAKLEAMLTEDMLYTNASDLGKWIFGTEETKDSESGEVTPATDPAKVNTTWVDTDTKYKTSSSDDKKDEDETKKEETSYTVTVYFLVREASRDTALTYNIAYLALSSGNKYAMKDAEEALAKFEKTDKKVEDLLALATDYTSNSGCTEIENARPDYFDMEEVDEWVFNLERKAGDYALLSSTSGTGDSAVTYFFIVLIESEGDEVWYADCEDDLVVSLVEDWLEEAQKTYPVTIRDRAINGIDL